MERERDWERERERERESRRLSERLFLILLCKNNSCVWLLQNRREYKQSGVLFLQTWPYYCPFGLAQEWIRDMTFLQPCYISVFF